MSGKTERAVAAFDTEIRKLAQEQLDSWCDSKELEAEDLTKQFDADDKMNAGLHRDYETLENFRKEERLTLWRSHVKEKGVMKTFLKAKVDEVLMRWVPKIREAGQKRVVGQRFH